MIVHSEGVARIINTFKMVQLQLGGQNVMQAQMQDQFVSQ